jgi:hypothetical protein
MVFISESYDGPPRRAASEAGRVRVLTICDIGFPEILQRGEHYADIAAEFVQLKADIIAASSAPAVAAKEATLVAPIVFVDCIRSVKQSYHTGRQSALSMSRLS